MEGEFLLIGDDGAGPRRQKKRTRIPPDQEASMEGEFLLICDDGAGPRCQKKRKCIPPSPFRFLSEWFMSSGCLRQQRGAAAVFS